MPTKRKGERYLGAELRVPLSDDGQVSAYAWPVRIVRIAGVPCGGPTVGIEVANQEVARFDCHDDRGHWHSGRYDPDHPTDTQVHFPDGLTGITEQLAWAFQSITDRAAALVSAAEYAEAAESVRPELAAAAVSALQLHLAAQGDLRTKAIEDGLIQV